MLTTTVNLQDIAKYSTIALKHKLYIESSQYLLKDMLRKSWRIRAISLYWREDNPIAVAVVFGKTVAIYVKRKYRKKGIARQLLKEINNKVNQTCLNADCKNFRKYLFNKYLDKHIVSDIYKRYL